MSYAVVDIKIYGYMIFLGKNYIHIVFILAYLWTNISLKTIEC